MINGNENPEPWYLGGTSPSSMPSESYTSNAQPMKRNPHRTYFDRGIKEYQLLIANDAEKFSISPDEIELVISDFAQGITKLVGRYLSDEIIEKVKDKGVKIDTRSTFKILTRVFSVHGIDLKKDDPKLFKGIEDLLNGYSNNVRHFRKSRVWTPTINDLKKHYETTGNFYIWFLQKVVPRNQWSSELFEPFANFRKLS